MHKPAKTWIQRLPDAVVDWVGSIKSLIIHTILFTANFTLYLFGVTFDTILLILTTIVSIEAIYLAIFMQISINQQSEMIEEIEQIEEQEHRQ